MFVHRRYNEHIIRFHLIIISNNSIYSVSVEDWCIVHIHILCQTDSAYSISIYCCSRLSPWLVWKHVSNSMRVWGFSFSVVPAQLHHFNDETNKTRKLLERQTKHLNYLRLYLVWNACSLRFYLFFYEKSVGKKEGWTGHNCPLIFHIEKMI